MSYNLFQESKLSKIKKYFSAVFILFVTFIIPVTVNQIYQNNNVGSSAAEIVTPTIVPSAPVTYNSQILSNINPVYIIIGVLGFILIVTWVILLILFFRSSKPESKLSQA